MRPVRSRMSRSLQIVDAAVQRDVLADRQVLVEREPLAHVADVALDALGFARRRRVRRRSRAPALGASSPVSMRIAVVLPAPLAPRNPNTSPARTSKVMLSTAVKPPKRRVRSRDVDRELARSCRARAFRRAHSRDEAVFDGRRCRLDACASANPRAARNARSSSAIAAARLAVPRVHVVERVAERIDRVRVADSRSASSAG